MSCTFIITRGVRKGQACGAKRTKGDPEYCCRHKNSFARDIDQVSAYVEINKELDKRLRSFEREAWIKIAKDKKLGGGLARHIASFI